VRRYWHGEASIGTVSENATFGIVEGLNSLEHFVRPQRFISTMTSCKPVDPVVLDRSYISFEFRVGVAPPKFYRSRSYPQEPKGEVVGSRWSYPNRWTREHSVMVFRDQRIEKMSPMR
jgi:hypothetical protein